MQGARNTGDPPTGQQPPKQRPPAEILTKAGTKADMDKFIDELYNDLAEENDKMERKLMAKKEQMRLKWRKNAQFRPTESKQSEKLAADGDTLMGSRVYTKNCMSCHSLDPNSSGRSHTGPALGLIYMRPVGADVNFNNYSENMLNSKKFWTSINLFRFIRKPSDFIYGSKCNFMAGGLENEQERIDLIKQKVVGRRFLRSYSKELSKNMRIKAQQIHGKDYVKMQLQSEAIKSQRSRQASRGQFK